MEITSPDDHTVLVFFAQLLVLVVVARGLGAAMRRVGQPAVIGELAAGLVLGPSVFGRVAPGAAQWLFPPDAVQSAMLFTVGWLGVVLLLVLTGFETDLELIRRLGRAAAFVAAGSLVVPLVFGLAVGLVMPALFVPGEDRQLFAFFMATALSISSLPVIAKILGELGLMRRNFGQVTLAAGMANDVVGWLILGVIAGLAASGTVSLGRLLLTLVGMAAFLAGAVTIGQRAVDAAFRQLRRIGAGVTGVVTVTLVFTLLFGLATQALHVEAVLGAFVAGIVIGRSRYFPSETEAHVESITMSFLAPVFFATAGLRVDLGVLDDPVVLLWGAVVIVVASTSKLVGALLGARLAGMSRREGVALGVGLNARGALEIIIATVGLSLGVLNRASYTVVVLMAMATSMMAPPMLRAVVRNWRGSAEEQARLDREEALSRNRFVQPSRILLPSRGGANSVAVARVIHRAWPQESAVTLFSVATDGDRPDLGTVAAELDGRDVDLEVLSGQDPVASIIAHARLGYGVIGLGATENPTPAVLLSPIADELLGASPVPVVIVRRRLARGRPGPVADGDPDPDRTLFRHILVPATGTPAARHAQEVAFALGRDDGADVSLIHVVDAPQQAPTGRLRRWAAGGVGLAAEERAEVAGRVIAQAQAFGLESGVEANAVVRTGSSAAEEIVLAAAELGADVIVLGATLRAAEGRPFVGHSVEHVLEHSDATVVVVAGPAGGPAPNGTAAPQVR